MNDSKECFEIVKISKIEMSDTAHTKQGDHGLGRTKNRRALPTQIASISLQTACIQGKHE